eukprot:scaffold774_cov75-Cylindrotheca_fusiformis.AAC.11
MANKMAHISRRSKGWKNWALTSSQRQGNSNCAKSTCDGTGSKAEKADKTIADFEEEGAVEVIENDQDWINYEEQVKNARRKELSTQTFWIKQHKETLQRVYQQVFPGIAFLPAAHPQFFIEKEVHNL